MNKPLIAGAAVVVIGGLGLWYYLESDSPGPAADASSASTAQMPQEPGIAHPVPSADTGPPPDMEHSDAELQTALPPVIGAAAVKDFLEHENMIRRFVVTVDNIPRQKIPLERRPFRKVAGSFLAQGDDAHATLDPANYARYQPYVAAVRNVDVTALTKVYVRFYPLLQHTYENLGYPKGYFNDRLVEAIDVLLATPQLTGPIDLVRPNVMYEFADPALEARPAGQKLMLRMGPDNAAAIKEKLTELRAALTAASPH
jgi:Protein of unknown function (DUF3014)